MNERLKIYIVAAIVGVLFVVAYQTHESKPNPKETASGAPSANRHSHSQKAHPTPLTIARKDYGDHRTRSIDDIRPGPNVSSEHVERALDRLNHLENQLSRRAARNDDRAQRELSEVRKMLGR